MLAHLARVLVLLACLMSAVALKPGLWQVRAGSEGGALQHRRLAHSCLGQRQLQCTCQLQLKLLYMHLHALTLPSCMPPWAVLLLLWENRSRCSLELVQLHQGMAPSGSSSELAQLHLAMASSGSSLKLVLPLSPAL